MTPADGPSRAEAAYAQLRQRIIRLELPPGTKFSEVQAAGWLETGKTPVREALSRLVHEGLVRTVPRVGYEVTPITLRDVQELFSLRAIVEPAAVEMAIGNVDPEWLTRLEQLCQAACKSDNLESVAEFLRMNSQFHLTIAEASGNGRLVAILRSVLEESERLYTIAVRLLDRTEEMVHEHRELIAALEEGNAAAARELTLAAIEGVRQQVVAALITTTSVMTTPVDVSTALAQANLSRPRRRS